MQVYEILTHNIIFHRTLFLHQLPYQPFNIIFLFISIEIVFDIFQTHAHGNRKSSLPTRPRQQKSPLLIPFFYKAPPTDLEKLLAAFRISVPSWEPWSRERQKAASRIQIRDTSSSSPRPGSVCTLSRASNILCAVMACRARCTPPVTIVGTSCLPSLASLDFSSSARTR